MSVWLMWPPSYAYVTCDITFCLLCLYPNKEKESQNKIKENKTKKIKENRMKLSSLFTTLIEIKRNYKIYNKEILVVIRELEN